MFRTALAALAALSFSLTPMASQAEGFDEEGLGKALFGLVAAVVLFEALNDRKDRETGADTEEAAAPLWPVHEPPVVRHVPPGQSGWLNPAGRERGGLRAHADQGYNDGLRAPVIRHHSQQPRSIARSVPATCLRSAETRYGTQHFFGQRCLERTFRGVSALPDRCAVQLYTRNGTRRGYDPLCLREEGYRASHG